MFQKITYEFVWDGTRQNQRKEGEVMVSAMQGKRNIDIPTNIYCKAGQFSDGIA